MALGQKEVSLKIKANTKKFQDEIKKLPGVTDKEAKKMARKFARQFHKAETSAALSSKKMAGHYKGAFAAMRIDAQKFAKILGPALFVGAAVGLAKMANSASEYTDKVMLMSKQTGMTAETLIGMEFAAKAAGSSIDEMKSGLNAFVMKAGQAANIGGASADVFDRLGVSVKDTGGELRSTEDIFRDTITAISEMDSASEKATTSAELFGARGAKIAAVFSDGTGALDEWAQKAKEAGIVMDKEALQASADMDRQMAELSLTMRGTAQEVGNTFIPAMILIAGGIGKVVSALAIGIDAIDDFMEAIMGIGQVSQNEADEFAAFEKAAASTILAVDALGESTTMAGGQMEFATTTAARMRAGLSELGDISAKLSGGTELNRHEYEQLKNTMTDFAKVAQNLGIDFLEVKDTAKAARIETRELAESKLDGLTSELDKLGESDALGKTAKDAERAAARLAGLNRAFELDALARVDEPLANFEKEIDRINAALISGLDSELGHDAILAAVDTLNAARLGKEEAYAAEWMAIRDRLTQAGIAGAKEEADGEIKAAKDAIDAREKQLSDIGEFSNALVAMTGAFMETAAQQIDNEESDALAGAEGNLEAQERIRAKFDKRRKSELAGIFKAQQATEIASAVMSGASAAIGALAPPPTGLGVILGPAMALVVAATTAAQIATIASQKPSFHSGGIVGGSGDQPITAQSGEVVLSRAAVGSLGGASAANSLNRAGAGGGPMVVQMVYKQRVLDQLIVDNLAKGGPLKNALNNATRTGRRGRVGGLL